MESKNTDGSQRVFAIDFETFYDMEYGVEILGNYHYVHDSRFDAYLVAVVELLPDGTQGKHWVGSPKNMPWAKFDGALLVAHNVSFDKSVFDRLKELGVIPPDCTVDWVCTADLAAFLGAPRNLKGAANVLLGVDVDKEVRGKMCRVTWVEAQARGWGEKLREYVLRDAKLCGRLWQQYSAEWSAMEKEISALNREIGEEGVRVDVKRLQDARKKLGAQVADALAKIPWREEDAILSSLAYNRQCAREGIGVPPCRDKKDPDFRAFVEEYGEEHPWIAAVQDYRGLCALDKKLETLERRVREDGVAMVNSLRYFGAGTGRFSGSGGFNIQNLHKGEHYGVDLRSLFIPGEGNAFVISDLSQVEARILLYLVGDQEQLELIRKGLSVYEAHARKTLGYNGKEKLKEANPNLYALAKSRVLGLGYGCGHVRFRDLAESLAGVKLSEEESQQQVDDFRASNNKIVQYWKWWDRQIAFCDPGEDLVVPLLSGRKLRYRNVHTEEGNWIATVQGRPVKIYGGKLTENIVQATARDVFVEMLLQIAALPDVKIRFHVHDEVVAEVPENHAEMFRQGIRQIMSIAPDWLMGCPLDAEAIVSQKYTK